MLDALGHEDQPERLTELDDGPGEGGIGVAAGDVVDEGLVDLENVEGKASEVGERRVARSEIVHRQGDAEGLEGVEAGEDGGTALDHDVLGDLEGEVFGPQPGRGEGGGDDVDDVVLDELGGGQVHRQAKAVPRVPVGPAAHLAAGFVEGPG